MRKAADMPEVIVSEDGASIPAHVLRDAGIQPGDRLTFVRTTDLEVIVPPVPGDTSKP